jgi:hypothetical protein
MSEFRQSARRELERIDKEIARLGKEAQENYERRGLLRALLDLYPYPVASTTVSISQPAARARNRIGPRAPTAGAGNVFTRLSRRGTTPPGPAPADARVLNAIVNNPNINVENLRGRVTGMAPNIIGTCLRRLLKAGYITGSPRTGPFRATGVAPTEPRPTVTRLASSYPRQKVTREEVIDAVRSMSAEHPEGVGPHQVIDKLQQPDHYIDYPQLQVLMTNLAKGSEIRKLGPGRYLPAEPAAA